MIAYIIKVSLCWILFYALYQVLYKKITFFSANRAYLVSTLILGAMIPLLQYIPIATEQYEVVSYVAPLLLEVDHLQLMVQEESSFNVQSIFLWVYLIGLVIAGIRFLFGMRNIFQLYWTGTKEQKTNYVLVKTDKLHLPFSFYKWVFISNQLPLKKKIKTILEHELCHINERHTFDVLLVELIKIAFWCSPPIYLYKKELKQVHEYIADNVTLVNENKEEYGQLLLGQSSSGIELSLTHQFFNSHLKKRIQMMNQKKSSKKALVSYLAMVPLLLFMGLSFSSYVNKPEVPETVIVPTENVNETDALKGDPVKEIQAKISALFGLSETEFKKEKQKVYNELMDTYPKHADLIKSQFSNYAGANKKVDLAQLEEANLYTIDTIITFDFDTYEETVRIVKTEREPVVVSNTTEEVENINIQTPATANFKFNDKDTPYKVVSHMPIFPGCEKLKGSHHDKFDCTQKKVLEYVFDNVNYPKVALEQKIEGMCVVQFVIRKDGTITDLNLVRNIGGGCGEAAINVVEKMKQSLGRWTPGEHENKKVDVYYSLPIRFKLNGDEQVAKKDEESNQVERIDTLTVFNRETKEEEVRIVKVFKKEKEEKNDSELFKVVEEMPRFPGCEDMSGTAKEKEGCAKEKMLNFIYKNLKYPEVAREAAVEGVTVVQFVVRKTGELTDLKLLRDIGGDCGEASLDIIKKMNAMPERWTPGKQNNKAVDVVYTLPIKYKLADEAKTDIEKKMGYPICVLDGKIVTEDQLKGLKIDRANVLKGAAAIEKYGAQGQQGVVELFTRKESSKTLDLENIRIAKMDFETFKVFPNPVKNTLNLSFISKEEGAVEVHLFDETGKQLITKKIESKAFNEVFDLSNMQTTQTLFLTVSQNEKVHTQKIVRAE